MQTFRDRKFQMLGAAGATLTAVALLGLEMQSRASVPPVGVQQRLAELRATLPEDQADGSVLEAADFDGQRVILHLQADNRLDLRLLRDDSRAERCASWSHAFRSGEVAQVEYRYRQDGSVSSLHLDRAVCG